MTLTLPRALEIDINLIPVEEDKALMLARSLWEFDGRPIEPQPLRRSLERILTLCQREGVRYTAILLCRKKELERGAWVPDPALAIPEEHPGDPNCTICRGAGVITNPGGLSGRNCECYIRKRSAKGDPATPEQALDCQPRRGSSL